MGLKIDADCARVYAWKGPQFLLFLFSTTKQWLDIKL